MTPGLLTQAMTRLLQTLTVVIPYRQGLGVSQTVIRLQSVLYGG